MGTWQVKFSRSTAIMKEEPVREEIDKIYLRITGMTCASCVNSIERGLMKKRGILKLL